MEKVLPRYLKASVQEDLKTRMVFVGGPRQVGKTVFALGTRDYEKKGVRVLPFQTFCRELELP